MNKTLLLAISILVFSCQKSDKKEVVVTSDSTELSNENNLAEELPEEDIEIEKNSKEPTNTDEMLDAYDKYVNEYVTFYKNMENGNPSAMQNYASFMIKAQKYADKMEKVQKDGNFSIEQLKRMNDINFKMMKVMENPVELTTGFDEEK